LFRPIDFLCGAKVRSFRLFGLVSLCIFFIQIRFGEFVYRLKDAAASKKGMVNFKIHHSLFLCVVV
jgi:hypothetical protein